MTRPGAGPALRRWVSVALVVIGGLSAWLVAGAPWWAPALLLAGGLAGRLVAALLPGRYRTITVRAGVLAAAVWLATGLHLAGWAFAAGAVLLVGLVSWPPDPRRGTGATRTRLILGVTGTVLLLAGVAGTALEGARAAQARAELDAHAGDFTRAQMLPASPARAVQALLRAIAEDDPRPACSMFSPTAATQLATAHGAADCADAVHRLHSQVRDPARYTQPDRGSITETMAPDGLTGTGNGCGLTWTGLPRLLDPGPIESAPAPGPAPGVLDGQRQLGQGYLVTRYLPCAPAPARPG